MPGRFDQAVPKNWLDAFGLLVQFVGVIVIFWQGIAVIQAFQTGADTWPWSVLMGIAALAIGMLGYVIRCVARHEPVLRNRS